MHHSRKEFTSIIKSDIERWGLNDTEKSHYQQYVSLWSDDNLSQIGDFQYVDINQNSRVSYYFDREKGIQKSSNESFDLYESYVKKKIKEWSNISYDNLIILYEIVPYEVLTNIFANANNGNHDAMVTKTTMVNIIENVQLNRDGKRQKLAPDPCR